MKFLLACLLLNLALVNSATLSPAVEVPEYGFTVEEPEPGIEIDLDPENIITNGYTAAEGAVPYIVFLAFRRGNSGSWCGGSIIGNTWVVTASHCSKSFNSVTVYYGSNRRQQGSVQHTVDGSNIINHPTYDIALIRTPHVQFTDRINRVTLPNFNSNDLYVNQRTTACGWGQTTTSNAAQNLQCVDAIVMSNNQCARHYGSRTIHNGILCTSTSGGKSVCSGDSGGPLVTQSNTILIGISQFVSTRGCTAGFPAGFTRVTSHLQWIRSQTGISY